LSVGGSRWVELLDQPMEGGFELRLVLIGMSADEVDNLAITVSGLFVIAARFVDHPQPIISIVYFGVADEQIAGGLLSLVDFAGADQIDYAIGCVGELIELIEFIQ